MRQDLRSSIQMLSAQYTKIVESNRDEYQRPLYEVIAIALGVIGFFSLPNLSDVFDVVGWLFVITLVSVLIYNSKATLFQIIQAFKKWWNQFRL
jgi:hypothetical protein